MGSEKKTRLDGYERRYRELAQQLADIGLIASGSVPQRFNRCGRANCTCHDDSPKLHGPYWHWTAKDDGRTVNKRLSESETRLYLEWISNDRKMRNLVAEMRAVAVKAGEILMDQVHAG